MSRLEAFKSKIESMDSLQKKVAGWKLLSKKIVFTNGCFDILHKGHVNYLAEAADLGDILIIGVNSDRSVRKLKGPSRPVNEESSRCEVLASLGFVSAVIVFDEDTPYELIKMIQPDVLVKGGDWKAEDIVGNDIVSQKGGVVKSIAFLPGYSTTLIEKKIKES
jgi:rfaE bifunctional protein nucleotidyltransferase chain/domain